MDDQQMSEFLLAAAGLCGVLWFFMLHLEG